MFLSKRASAVLVGTCLLLLLPGVALGDIYAYKDANGVWHFTNIQTDRPYRLFMRTYKKRPNEFIKKYDGIIQQAAKRFKLDPLFVKAVIKAESAFDYRAVSNKGAKGLMQLMPETANQMQVNNPFNPEENIIGGTRYLGILMERYKNNKSLALAAYNAGPETVDTYKGVPPYPETRTFIQRVMGYYGDYRAGQRK
ncbi:MAG: lytic transglycosylase domain-containing protein [Deltaproteobacteria bacterium]|nr:lytic transglycosylase domain-containing protein [Deltaproteobacteria bacterium]